MGHSSIFCVQTGDIYYINWRTGMKVEEDPRESANYSGPCYCSDEDEDDSSDYDSEESSTESSPASYSSTAARVPPNVATSKGHVLVVGGCKTCLMYRMVPKQVKECPKCGGQLLHFDGSKNGSLWSAGLSEWPAEFNSAWFKAPTLILLQNPLMIWFSISSLFLWRSLSWPPGS